MIGSIVYATNQGLGILAKSFYDNGVIDRVIVRTHNTRKNHYEWYPDRFTNQHEFFEGLDAVLLFETAHYRNIYDEAKKRGIRVILMPMYECTLPWEIQQADVIINPSKLDQRYYPQGTFVPVPVDVPWRLREKAEHFVHNAGYGGLGGRNGTQELEEAIPFLKTKPKITIRSQRTGEVPYEDLWKEGDVFVFPEKFNGLSLPLQEAFASGMLVMTTERYPNTTYLPRAPLIPVKGNSTQKISVDFEMAIIDPRDIAMTIDKWYNRDIREYSERGRVFAEERSWSRLKDTYIQICHG